MKSRTVAVKRKSQSKKQRPGTVAVVDGGGGGDEGGVGSSPADESPAGRHKTMAQRQTLALRKERLNRRKTSRWLSAQYDSPHPPATLYRCPPTHSPLTPAAN